MDAGICLEESSEGRQEIAIGGLELLLIHLKSATGLLLDGPLLGILVSDDTELQ